MPGKRVDTRQIGRSQPGRPAPPASVRAQADAEKSLAGALSVAIEQVVPDPGQPRRAMDPPRLAALAASITREGILQPLVVRTAGYLEDGRTRYMVVTGGRRYAAAVQAGLTRLPVVVRESEGAALRALQLTENLQREDLSEMDQARAYKELMDLDDLSPREVAERLHISDQHVRERLRVLADPVLAPAVAQAQISATTARDILKLPEQEQETLRTRVERGERIQLSDVDQVREQVRATGQSAPRRNPGSGRKRISQTAFEKSPVSPVIAPPLSGVPMAEPSTDPGREQAEGLAAPLPSRPADSAPQSTVIVPSSRPAVSADDELTSLVLAAGGPEAALRLLSYARRHDLSLAALAQAIQQLGERA